MAQHKVEFHVVDLVRGLRLEPLVDQCEFGLASQQLEVVEDRAEAGHVDESAARPVLVLVVRLDQQPAVPHFGAQALHQAVQALLLVGGEHVAGVQDGGGVELVEALGGVLLEVLLGKDARDLFAEINVVNQGRVAVVEGGVVLFEHAVLLDGELNLLAVKD